MCNNPFFNDANLDIKPSDEELESFYMSDEELMTMRGTNTRTNKKKINKDEVEPYDD